MAASAPLNAAPETVNDLAAPTLRSANVPVRLESDTESPLITPDKLVPTPLTSTVLKPSYTLVPVKVPVTVMYLGVNVSKPTLLYVTVKPGFTTPLAAVMA